MEKRNERVEKGSWWEDWIMTISIGGREERKDGWG